MGRWYETGTLKGWQDSLWLKPVRNKKATVSFGRGLVSPGIDPGTVGMRATNPVLKFVSCYLWRAGYDSGNASRFYMGGTRIESQQMDRPLVGGGRSLFSLAEILPRNARRRAVLTAHKSEPERVRGPNSWHPEEKIKSNSKKRTLSYSQNSPPFIEPEGSSSCSKEPATEPVTKRDWSNIKFLTLFL